MTKITIDVTEDDFQLKRLCKDLSGEYTWEVYWKAKEAFENEQNRINIGDFYLYRTTGGHTAILQCGKESDSPLLLGQSVKEPVKLPSHLQKPLAEFVEGQGK